MTDILLIFEVAEKKPRQKISAECSHLPPDAAHPTDPETNVKKSPRFIVRFGQISWRT
jgi:hypothetical protein